MSSFKSLGEIIKEKFMDKKVYIPLYQRNYKWDTDRAGQLVQDLLEQFNRDKGKDYNLGMLILYETNSEIQIIDGQQRMITLSLIVKALDRINDGDWFNLLFERDEGFDNQEKASPRYDYIYNTINIIDRQSVDIGRMVRNLEKIQNEINREIDNNRFFEYILDHVKFLYHETKSEPLDEFLNINFNKTPFCAADHIKAYMVLDAGGNEDDITISKIQELWKKLERVLFQIEDYSCEDYSVMENEMFSLIKKNYNEEILNMNRIEILFYNRYLEEQYKGKNAIKTLSKYHKSENSLREEYSRLSYYYDVMKSVLDEIAIVDKSGNRHPNYNALNAYNLLCHKNKNIHFFEIIGRPENIKNKIDVSAALKNYFNLTETSHEKINTINKPNAQNQFMETMLSSQNDYKTEKNISKKDYVKDNVNFKKYYDLFNSSFTEYISLIELGKKANSGVDKMLENGKKILSDLLENPNIERIMIPSIQRDYVMGSSNEYLKNYLQHISFMYSWSAYNIFKNNKSEVEYTEDQYLELENILFNNNSSEKILEFKEIKPREGQRRSKYNEYKSSLESEFHVEDFRNYGEGSPYAEYCKKINELVELNIRFNTSPICLSAYDKKFNTGCIIGYLDEDKTFWVYDGQQRLVTSIVLLALTREKHDTSLLKNLKKFSFEGRIGANKCLEILLDSDVLNNEITNKMLSYIDGKSSHSIYKLIENYNLLKEDSTIKINTAYLLRGMEFEFVMVDKIDDVEQLFIEMNEGLKLTSYEQYKAEFNHTVSKILDTSKAKSLLRKIDNEWLDFSEKEEKEVKILKYCVKMASYEINGYDNSLEYGSLQGLNREVVLLVENVVDRLVANNIDIVDITNTKNIKDYIYLWIDIMVCEFNKYEAEYMSLENRIYFKKDFKEFIKMYRKFIENEDGKEEFYSKCFKIIREFRDENSLAVPGQKDEKESQLETIYRHMLENRRDQFEFREISKWEKALNSYNLVMENKDKPFILSKITPKIIGPSLKITEDINICTYIDSLAIDQLISLCENVISNSSRIIYIEEELAKRLVLENEKCRSLIFTDRNRHSSEGGEYYSYANYRWNKSDEPYIDNNTQTDLSKEIIDTFTRRYKPLLKTTIDVTSERLNKCEKAKDVYNILTGSWYFKKDKSSFEKNITGCDVSVRRVSETNYRVFGSIEIDDVDELLYRYRYCDDKVKDHFEKYITAYYFFKTKDGDYQDKLYYIARSYLKRRNDRRKWYFNIFREKNISDDIKKNILPLFLDEDFENKDNNEYQNYWRQRGFSIISIDNKKVSGEKELSRIKL